MSKAHAAAAAKTATARFGDGQMGAYRCRACGKWHIGHRSRRERALVAQLAPPPLKHIVVAAGDVVEITWRHDDGSVVTQRHTMPSTQKE